VSSSIPTAPSLEQLRKLARELQRAHNAGQPEALARTRDHHHRSAAPLRLADAQLVVAREHGFASWPRLKAHISASDRGWTLLHQAAHMNHLELVRTLLGAGAPTAWFGHGDGGTPLVAALFWGHRRVAELIAAHDLAPGNLRVAAGLGRPDLVERLVEPDGRLAPAAGAHRGFYRPHTGLPLWQPSDDRQEILDEALVWACRSGRVNVLAALVQRGADVDADPYRGTPLAWAAMNGHPETVAWLLDHGASVDGRSTFGGPGHGLALTALHLAAQCGNASMARLLLDRGADPGIEDGIHHSTPLGWARHFASHEVAALLQEGRR
jgi:hypothetical protein